jgi:hypothetical protein
VKVSVNNNDLNIDQIRDRGGVNRTEIAPEAIADRISGVINPATSSLQFEDPFLERCNSYSCCERVNKGKTNYFCLFICYFLPQLLTI